MNNVLITGGCSFTDEIIYLDYNITPWPVQVSSFLNCHLVNTGRCGASNSYIENVVCDSMIRYKDSNPFIMVLWSDPRRVNANECFNILNTGGPHKGNVYNIWKHIEENYSSLCVINSLRSIWRTRNLAKQLNLKYIDLLGNWDIPRIGIKSNWRLPEFDRLSESERKRRVNEVNEKTLSDIKNNWYFKELEFSEKEIKYGHIMGYKEIPDDGHPNQKGHEFIADKFLDKLHNEQHKEFVYD